MNSSPSRAEAGEVASNQQPATSPDNPEVSWWCKLLTRVVACVGGVVALILGLVAAISIKPLCIIGGLLLMGTALLLLLFEAPICCQFFHIAKPLVEFADRRSFMQKALIYVALAIPPVGLCFGVTTLIGSGMIFAVGVLYGLMALGRKADRETMLAHARAADENSDKIDLVPGSR